jgi:hypothetical protein
MSGQNGLAYYAAEIAWVRDAGQTILTDGLGGRSWILQGLEAAAWDLVSLGYSFEEMAGTLALLAGTDHEQSRSMLLATVRRWAEMGILCAADGQQP